MNGGRVEKTDCISALQVTERLLNTLLPRRKNCQSSQDDITVPSCGRSQAVRRARLTLLIGCECRNPKAAVPEIAADVAPKVLVFATEPCVALVSYDAFTVNVEKRRTMVPTEHEDHPQSESGRRPTNADLPCAIR